MKLITHKSIIKFMGFIAFNKFNYGITQKGCPFGQPRIRFSLVVVLYYFTIWSLLVSMTRSPATKVYK
jgi:hypothetical protein